ncbi:hypothetical protein M407DRAFT_24682 [Tulasnella calospora MUT 4182]|uniref:Uncharacterized protein n=1 Tax=Tulasnella calospora MUT 4182 TaxID=1051891 RepID=A0A0C3KX44_9AGAM|nr:hypothetical protein M407DRAFT_24682 [Tulasnella calospora MUT 4182]
MLHCRNDLTSQHQGLHCNLRRPRLHQQVNREIVNDLTNCGKRHEMPLPGNPK